MSRQRHTAEQITSKLREAEVLQGKGMPMEEENNRWQDPRRIDNGHNNNLSR